MLSLLNALKFQPKLVRQEAPSDMASEALCAEAIAAYHAGRTEGAVPETSVWKIHTDTAQRGLLNVLEKGATRELAAYMARLHATPLLRGYDQHGGITAKLDEGQNRRNTHARTIFAALARLGAGLGTLRHFKPEQAENFPYLLRDQTDTVVRDIAAALGLTGGVPNTGPGAYGLDTPLGPLSYRHVFALGYLREIRNILAMAPGRYTQIVEIGGGLGRTAFHAARDLGLTYSVIDLPAVSVSQYLLLRGNGVPTTLWDDTPARPGQVRLINAFAQHDPADFTGALFVNFDSLVEMGATTQDAYFDLIRDAGGDLLSINHESRKTMTPEGHLQNWNLRRFADWGYTPGPRTLFWEREAYVSQVFVRAG